MLINLCLDLIYIIFVQTIVCCQLLLGFVVCRGHNNNNNNNNNNTQTYMGDNIKMDLQKLGCEGMD
jgi:hypothetical protein